MCFIKNERRNCVLELVIFRKIYLLISKNKSSFDYIFIENTPAMTENIGYKLKRLREDNNISQKDLAVQSGVKLDHIELIESGKVFPSLATLIKLARTLGIRLGTFLDGMESPEPTVTTPTEQVPQVSVYLSKGNGADVEHLKYCSLAENKTDRNMEPFVINVEYSTPDEMASMSHHEGEEFIYVLSGSVVIRYGEETYNLEKGESIYFDSIVPHNISVPGPGQQAKVLAVVYTPF